MKTGQLSGTCSVQCLCQLLQWREKNSDNNNIDLATHALNKLELNICKSLQNSRCVLRVRTYDASLKLVVVCKTLYLMTLNQLLYFIICKLLVILSMTIVGLRLRGGG